MSEPSAPVPFSEALRFWCKLGFISFGGPAGQIAIMHRELVERRQWLSEAQFLHALNFCMLLPGPEAQQLAIYIGWLKHRALGGLAAGILFVLPGFLLITAIAAAYMLWRSIDVVQGVLLGFQAAVLAIVVEAVHRIGRRALKDRFAYWVAAAAFLAIFAFDVPFPVVVVAAALAGWIRQRTLKADTAVSVAPTSSHTRSNWLYTTKVLLLGLTLWFAPVLAIIAWLGPTHLLTAQGWFFSKMAVVTFGGAYAVLSYVAQQAVDRYSWLTTDDMMQGLALAETTPGPLILVLTFVGFVAAFNDAAPFSPIVAGLLGAVITTWVTFVPSFLWIFLGAPHVEHLSQRPALSAALSAVTAAVVGVILHLALWFALHSLFADVGELRYGPFVLPAPWLASVHAWQAVLTVGAIAAYLWLRLPMMWTLVVCGVAGVVIQLA